jgi:hypothetical protein
MVTSEARWGQKKKKKTQDVSYYGGMTSAEDLEEGELRKNERN